MNSRATGTRTRRTQGIAPDLYARKDALISLIRSISAKEPKPSRLLHNQIGLTDAEFRKLAAYLTEKNQAPIGSDNRGFFWASSSDAMRRKLKHLVSRRKGLTRHIVAVIGQIREIEARERAAAGSPDSVQESLKLEFVCTTELSPSARGFASL